jgi:hypothetical protein
METELSRIGTSCSWSVGANGAAVCRFNNVYRNLLTEWTATFKDDKLEKLISKASFSWDIHGYGDNYSPKVTSTGSKGDVVRYCSPAFYNDFISSLVRTFGSPISAPEKTARDLSTELSRDRCEGRTLRACRAQQTETKEQYIFEVSPGLLLRFNWLQWSGSFKVDMYSDKIQYRDWGGCSYEQFVTAKY